MTYSDRASKSIFILYALSMTLFQRSFFGRNVRIIVGLGTINDGFDLFSGNFCLATIRV